ncbi:hypothetical protein [Streptomyces sp. NPDC052107]|uniref:hypothetical protein n=1 Tax=Streptomyces sp. NPDC052107 TaxID=3155632 RepID=UPI00342FA69F
MKLAKRFATISAAATAAILFSVGGAQTQGDGGSSRCWATFGNQTTNNNNGDTQVPGTGTGGLLPLRGKSPFNFQVRYPTGQTGTGNTFTGNQNVNCYQS